jgi:hypothetical protein
MKKFYQLLLLSFLFCAVGCKKNEPIPIVNNTDLSVAQTVDAKPKPLTVITIAGLFNTQGNKDGTGEQARFNYPHGIDLADDGTLYVADLFNNAIRKVSTTGVVTTLKLPEATDGQILQLPEKVLVTKDGTISILANNSLTPVNQHKFWIIKPSGELLTPASQVNYYTYGYFCIAKDPFSNYLQISGQRVVTNAVNHRQGFIESAEIANGIIGQHPYTPPLDSLNTGSREYSQITQVYCGYNGVKYIVFRGKYVYKLTKSGVFTRIFRDINFHEIRDVTASKDSRTIYMVDRGAIVSITNNKLTELVGPATRPIVAHPDGVGKDAYVFADYIVLSKDENTIYFTDDNTVRKLILK